MVEEREVYYCNIHSTFFFQDESEGCESCISEWEGPIEPDDPRIDKAMVFRGESE